MDAEDLALDSKDIWTTNKIEKYEARPSIYSTMCLADFAAKLTPSGRKRDEEGQQIYSQRQFDRIIRYTPFDVADEGNFKRSMVTLLVVFRSESIDILQGKCKTST